MIAISAVILVASYVAFSQPLGMSGYVAWITILNVAWVLGITYYMGLTVAHDADGRLTRLIPFSQILVAGAGPACSALATSNGVLSPIFVVASIAATAGLIAILIAVRIDFGLGDHAAMQCRECIKSWGRSTDALFDRTQGHSRRDALSFPV